MAHAGGRPSIFTQELADTICAKLARGESMRTVCKDDALPSMEAIFCWLRTKPEFLQQYTRAKQEAADSFIEEMHDISDASAEIVGDGHDAARINAARLRVDTRKWIASKLKPKKYGERMQHASDEESPFACVVNINKSYGDDEKK
jgi:hypothetical protein